MTVRRKRWRSMVKVKIVRQSGVIPYLQDGKELKTILVTASGNSAFWLFPKGHLESNLSSSEAAALEAYEEAGIRGLIGKKSIGTYSYTKLGKEYRVKMYLLKVKKILKKWPEANRRSRDVLTFPEAIARLEISEMRELAEKIFSKLKTKTSVAKTDNENA